MPVNDQVVVDISVNAQRIERGVRDLNRNFGALNKRVDGAVDDLQRMDKQSLRRITGNVDRLASRTGVLRTAIAGAITQVGFFATQAVFSVFSRLTTGTVQAAEEMTNLRNRLIATGLSSEQAAGQIDELLDIALETRRPIGELGKQFISLQSAFRGTEFSVRDINQLIAGIGKVASISGAEVQQTTQAITTVLYSAALGKPEATSIISLLQSMPILLQEAANQAHQLGLTNEASAVALTQAIKNNQISGRNLVHLFVAATGELRNLNAEQTTFGDGATAINSVLTVLAGKINESTRAGDALGNSMIEIAETIRDMTPAIVQFANTAVNAFGLALKALEPFLETINTIDDLLEERDRSRQRAIANVGIDPNTGAAFNISTGRQVFTPDAIATAPANPSRGLIDFANQEDAQAALNRAITDWQRRADEAARLNRQNEKTATINAESANQNKSNIALAGRELSEQQKARIAGLKSLREEIQARILRGTIDKEIGLERLRGIAEELRIAQETNEARKAALVERRNADRELARLEERTLRERERAEREARQEAKRLRDIQERRERPFQDLAGNIQEGVRDLVRDVRDSDTSIATGLLQFGAQALDDIFNARREREQVEEALKVEITDISVQASEKLAAAFAPQQQALVAQNPALPPVQPAGGFVLAGGRSRLPRNPLDVVDPRELVLPHEVTDPALVDERRQQIRSGTILPPVLAHEGNDSLIRVIDGVHRSTAAIEEGVDLLVRILTDEELLAGLNGLSNNRGVARILAADELQGFRPRNSGFRGFNLGDLRVAIENARGVDISETSTRRDVDALDLTAELTDELRRSVDANEGTSGRLQRIIEFLRAPFGDTDPEGGFVGEQRDRPQSEITDESLERLARRLGIEPGTPPEPVRNTRETFRIDPETGRIGNTDLFVHQDARLQAAFGEGIPERLQSGIVGGGILPVREGFEIQAGANLFTPNLAAPLDITTPDPSTLNAVDRAARMLIDLFFDNFESVLDERARTLIPEFLDTTVNNSETVQAIRSTIRRAEQSGDTAGFGSPANIAALNRDLTDVIGKLTTEIRQGIEEGSITNLDIVRGAAGAEGVDRAIEEANRRNVAQNAELIEQLSNTLQRASGQLPDVQQQLLLPEFATQPQDPTVANQILESIRNLPERIAEVLQFQTPQAREAAAQERALTQQADREVGERFARRLDRTPESSEQQPATGELIDLQENREFQRRSGQAAGRRIRQRIRRSIAAERTFLLDLFDDVLANELNRRDRGQEFLDGLVNFADEIRQNLIHSLRDSEPFSASNSLLVGQLLEIAERRNFEVRPSLGERLQRSERLPPPRGRLAEVGEIETGRRRRVAEGGGRTAGLATDTNQFPVLDFSQDAIQALDKFNEDFGLHLRSFNESIRDPNAQTPISLSVRASDFVSTASRFGDDLALAIDDLSGRIRAIQESLATGDIPERGRTTEGLTAELNELKGLRQDLIDAAANAETALQGSLQEATDRINAVAESGSQDIIKELTEGVSAVERDAGDRLTASIGIDPASAERTINRLTIALQDTNRVLNRLTAIREGLSPAEGGAELAEANIFDAAINAQTKQQENLTNEIRRIADRVEAVARPQRRRQRSRGNVFLLPFGDSDPEGGFFDPSRSQPRSQPQQQPAVEPQVVEPQVVDQLPDNVRNIQKGRRVLQGVRAVTRVARGNVPSAALDALLGALDVYLLAEELNQIEQRAFLATLDRLSEERSKELTDIIERARNVAQDLKLSDEERRRELEALAEDVNQIAAGAEGISAPITPNTPSTTFNFGEGATITPGGATISPTGGIPFGAQAQTLGLQGFQPPRPQTLELNQQQAELVPAIQDLQRLVANETPERQREIFQEVASAISMLPPNRQLEGLTLEIKRLTEGLGENTEAQEEANNQPQQTQQAQGQQQPLAQDPSQPSRFLSFLGDQLQLATPLVAESREGQQLANRVGNVFNVAAGAVTESQEEDGLSEETLTRIGTTISGVFAGSAELAFAGIISDLRESALVPFAEAITQAQEDQNELAESVANSIESLNISANASSRAINSLQNSNSVLASLHRDAIASGDTEFADSVRDQINQNLTQIRRHEEQLIKIAEEQLAVQKASEERREELVQEEREAQERYQREQREQQERAQRANAIGDIFGSLARFIPVVGEIAAPFVGTGARLIASSQFQEGGYTGAGPANEPAGIVHRDEYVLPQPITRHLRDGRTVTIGDGSAQQRPVINITIRNEYDGSIVSQHLQSDVGDEEIRNILAANNIVANA